LVDAGDNHRLGMVAEKGGNGSLLLDRRVSRVEHEHLKAARKESIVKRAEIVGEDAVGERRHDSADGVSAR
jgi:hypothetical protein